MAYESGTVASYYATLFPARNDVYSRWTADGWRPVRAPLTADVVLAGLSGRGPSISGYMIAPGSISHSVAIDFDAQEGREQAALQCRFMWDAGLPAYIETSRRGAHLWCILDDLLPAKTIRNGLRALLRAAGLPPEDPKIELRPGSDTVDDDGLGHCIRLPFMPHPKTGERGLMTDADGVRLGPSLAQVILDIEWAPAGTLVEWAATWRPKVRMLPAYRNPHSFPPDDSRASEILRDLWGVANARPGKAVRCPAHDDHEPSLNIFPDDRRVMCMTPACELNNDGHGRGTYELRTLAAQRRG